MTLAESILACVRGANEARNASMQEGGMFNYVNGIEVITFYQDNSALLIFGGMTVIAGKGA